ncbi:hypothetical protein QUC31_015824 [Theobroma cacao]
MESYKQLQEQSFFAILFTIIVSILVVTIRVKGKKKRQRRPPEPAGALPFLGHLHLLGKHQLLHRTFGDMADQYGPAFLVRLGIHQALVVSNSEVAKECFTTNDRVFPTRPKSLAIKLMGRWLELLKHVRDTEINCFVKDLYEQSVKSGGLAVVEMKERIGDLAMNIIVSTVAGKRYSGIEGCCDDESRRCQKAMGDFFYLAGLFLVSDAVPFLGWLDVVMGRISNIKKTAKELDLVLGSLVNEHRRWRLRKSIKGEQDFIDVMLSVMDDGNIPTQEADTTIKATRLSLILGSNDTNVITLTWALSLLLNNRHVLKRAQDELDIHVGKHRKVEESDINNLVYLQAIVKETLRLHTAVPLSVPREAMEDCTIAGFHVPAVMPLALAGLLHGFEWGTVSDIAIDMSETPGLTVPKATPLEVTLTPRLPSMLYG